MPTRIQGVIATTHLDLQGERLTKSALESMVAQINAKECLGVVVEHDPLVPPLGKVVSAVLRQRPDGEYEVYAVSELFDDAEEVTLSDGSIGLMMHLPSDTRPFARREARASDITQVGYDRANFASHRDASTFLRSVARDQSVRFHLVARKAVISDPAFWVTLSTSTVILLFASRMASKTAEAVADKVATDISALYDLVKQSFVNAAKLCVPRNKPITYIFVAPATPVVEFVARVTTWGLLGSALTVAKLSPAFSRAVELSSLVAATHVQFQLGVTGNWEETYALTKNGDVLGSPACLGRLKEQRRVLLDSKGFSWSGRVKTDEEEAPPDDSEGSGRSE